MCAAGNVRGNLNIKDFLESEYILVKLQRCGKIATYNAKVGSGVY
jgi:hypothetical protein